MPASRLTSRRRRSSHTLFTPAKAGIYGIPARPVTFAPNITPVTYTEVDPEDDPLSSDALTAQTFTSKLFPPSETPAPPPTRRRCPPGKRRSQGYIPRPPNAFMLFRADFVRQKHVPGNIETNHGSLSKIIGTCWHQLPLEEKRVWEVKAKQEKAAHKAMFPNYRFRPVHNKNKSTPNTSSANANALDRDDIKRKDKQPTTAEDERRCDEVAQLLLEGKKGEELAKAVRDLDRARSMEREREMEEYELGVGGDDEQASSTPNYDFGNANQEQHDAATLHMPVSQHPHVFSMGASYASSLMHHGMALNTGMNMNMNMGYHRRSSSVPLPNEWQSYLSTSASLTNGIANPSISQYTSMLRSISPVGSIARFNHAFPPQQLQHQHQEHFTDPFHQSSFSPTNPATLNTRDYQVAPGPEYTPSYHQDTQLFHPIPQHQPHNQHTMLPFMTQTTPRSSLGLGQRRASSAQPMLMRSWTMPGEFDYSSMNMAMGIERDPSPLPEVESGLFADFSFGGPSSSSSMGGGGAGEEKPANTCADEQIDPASSGLGLANAIPPTSLSLSHIDTSVSLSAYSPIAVPQSSMSASTTSSSCPSATLPELSYNSSSSNVTANTSGDGNANVNVHVNAANGANMDSHDMSTYMHLDGLYVPDPSSFSINTSNYTMGMYSAGDHRHQRQHGPSQQAHQVYSQDAYSIGVGVGMGYYEYEVDSVVKSHPHSHLAEGYQSEAYFEATA